MPLKRPRADLLEVLAGASPIIPVGTSDFTKPIESGPFQVVSYEPGKTTVLKAFKQYRGGAPMPDELEIISINDADARLRALKSGQIDYAVTVTPTAARVESHNPQLRIIDGGVANSLALTWTKPPFNDVRARRAMALATDRKALLDIAFQGYGAVGNDVMGQGMPGFIALPTRTYDPDQAKQLLAQAGQPDLKFTIRTFDQPPGALAATQLWVQQLAKIGVTATLNTVPVTSAYDTEGQNSALIQLGTFYNRPTLLETKNFFASDVPVGLNGGYLPASLDTLLTQAQTTVDPAAQQRVVEQIAKQFYDDAPMWCGDTRITLISPCRASRAWS